MPSSSLAFDELPRGTGGTGATEAINQVLHDAGLDAPASLYDEALALAREGRLAPAAERLRMLLVLDPSDADAALLLGKVLAGMARWQEALTWLDAASANGAVLPPGLRDEVSDALRREVQEAEAERERRQARERGELRGLRAEAKRLRAENSVLEQRLMELDKRVRLWSGATALVAGCASALLLAAMLFGGPEGDPDAVASPQALTAAPAAPVAAEVAAPEAGQPEIQTFDPASPKAEAPKAEAPKADKPAAAPVGEKRADKANNQAGAALVTMHTVQTGESLGAIAQRYYGKSSEWKRILNANPDVLKGNAKKLKPGQKLRIPKG